jgi:glutathione S-transferase
MKGEAMSVNLELWQTEWCPGSRRVRQRLTELGVSYLVRQVAVDPTDRAELEDATGDRSIPVLIADGQIVRGEEAILSYLDERFVEPPGATDQREKAAKAKRKELEQACPKLTATPTP